MSEFLLNCPFCGCREVEVARTNKNACWIRCNDCGADAPSDKTRKKAFELWNRRAINFTATIVDDGDKNFNH